MRQKLVENAKAENLNATFWPILMLFQIIFQAILRTFEGFSTNLLLTSIFVGVGIPRTFFVPGEWGNPGTRNFPRGIPGEANLPNRFYTKTEK